MKLGMSLYRIFYAEGVLSDYFYHIVFTDEFNRKTCGFDSYA